MEQWLDIVGAYTHDKYRWVVEIDPTSRSKVKVKYASLLKPCSTINHEQMV